ncbi:NACHT and WD repeat domain-containing protein 2-like [Haliotis rufescens]|uniref:NACHT and WD repeat domain-containing protein 2-like n=1 Tax=Haliotis rufescens TaxID=6454 RepID=UPI00201F9386|nr:NACHT and WD repeat domain-containing protein 2-like [Haliotis rufescens]
MASVLDSQCVDILRGRLGDPGSSLVPRRGVRLYLCSTGSDSQTERNAFVETVYPKLRQYCRNQYGVEFQVVDLEWGLRPDIDNVTPVSAEFRQGEITRCQKLSVGPSFLAFVGQKYGASPLHATIPASEYETIRMALHNHRSRETRGAPLLDDWYIRDDNHIPPVYVLKPASEVIDDISSEDENKRSAAECLKKETEAKIRRLLQKGAEFCYSEGSIDSDTKIKYFISEQDIEMTMGICDSGNPQQHCLLVLRDIIDLKNYIGDERTPCFTDIICNDKTDKLELDAEADLKLQQVKKRAKNLVSQNNAICYDVLWRYDDVINSKLHRKYLDGLCNQVHDRLVQLIDETVPRRRMDFPELCLEPLLHLERCKQLGAHFYGRQDTLSQVQAYLEEESSLPLIIYGESGSGKTKLLSRIAQEISNIYGDGGTLIIRYVGFTQMSSDVRQILSSICSQLCAIINRDQASIPSDVKDLPVYFQELLNSVPNYLSVVILLDALEKILPDNNANLMTWFPASLPVNVKMIITCQPSSNKILETLRSDIVQDDSAYMQLDNLSGDECEGLMKEILAASGRQITQEQYETYKESFTKCSLPMYIHLLAEEGKTLHSFLGTDSISKTSGILDAINMFFSKLEARHCKVFVSRCMAFMAASETGLSDCEMEDLLSLDEDALNSIYTGYHPAIRRIPPQKWLELKRNLEQFMTYRNTDDATIYSWNHDLFLQVCQARYLCEESVKRKTHSVLADYYLGTWTDTPKPVTKAETKSDVILLPCGDTSDRRVPAQPLTFTSNGSGVKFNKRKYDKVPRHLDLSGRADEFKTLVLFNYEWLYNKIKALSLQHIMADFSLSPASEASLVEGALRVSEPTLQRDINNLPAEITGRLLPYYTTHANVRELVNQCDTTGLDHCALIPNFPYLQVPGSSLQFTMECPVPSEYFGITNKDRFLLTKERDSSYIYMFDLLNGGLKDTVFTSNGDFLVTPNGKYFVIVDHVTEKAIKFHEADTGSFLGQIIILNHIQMKPTETYKKGPMCITDDRLCAIVTTDTSFLCIADVSSCKLLQIVALDGKSTICEISPDGKYVFCSSNEYLLSYDLDSLDLLCTLSVGYKPSSFTFSHDGYRAFLSNDVEAKLYTLHISFGVVDMSYKGILDEILQDDTILDLKVSPDDELVLVRGNRILLVHDRATESVCAKLERPRDIPEEFRLPKSHYVELNFTKAEFSSDGKYVIGTIFRNVYIWQIETQSVVTSLQAPIGIITSLLVTKHRNQVITQLQGHKTIQVWNIEEAVNKVDMLDRVTGPIQQVLLTEDGSVAIVQCEESDAIGMIDMKTGTMLDLLTHDSDVKDMAITPAGDYLLLTVVPQMSDTSTRIWDMTDRRVIKEFGNAPGYCVCLNEKNIIIFVGQKDITFRAPYFITVMQFAAGAFAEEEHAQALKFVLKKPFVTRNDRYLVALTAKDYLENSGVYDTPTICIFDLNKDMRLACYTLESLGLVDNEDNIIDLRPCPCMENLIAVIYSTSTSPDGCHNGIENGYQNNPSHFGFILFEVGNGWVIRKIDPFLDSTADIQDVLFAKDFNFCLDKESRIFDLWSGEYTDQIANPPSVPKVLVLDGSVVVYFKGSMIYAIRICDSEIIAQCDVHAPVCSLTLCKDDRTLIVGCTDGALVSYVLIDPAVENPQLVLARISSRQLPQSPTPAVDGKTSRSWDKIDQLSFRSYSRPPSVVSLGPREKELLKRVPHLPRERPKSDTQMYSKSAVCSVM